MFNDEFDILDLHLAELGDKVDAIVLVESPKTFTGIPKPLNFDLNRERYRPHLDRIRHIVAGDPTMDSAFAWVRDSHQRNSVLAGLNGFARDQDLVVVADADEIVNFEQIKDFKGDYACLRVWLYWYFLNLKRVRGDYQSYSPFPAICRYEVLRHISPHELRMFAGRSRVEVQRLWIDDGGWHFSYIGGEEFIVRKLQSFAHQELDTPQKPAEWRQVLEKFRTGIESGLEWCAVEIDDSFPEALRCNRQKYAEFIIPTSPATLSQALNEMQRKYERAIGARK